MFRKLSPFSSCKSSGNRCSGLVCLCWKIEQIILIFIFVYYLKNGSFNNRLRYKVKNSSIKHNLKLESVG